MSGPGGPARRLLTGCLVCSRCRAPLVADTWTSWQTRPVTIREKERYAVRKARYVCPSCLGIAILAGPIESIIAAAVEHRRGVRLPSRRDQARAVIAHAISRVDVLPARPGQDIFDPSRLRVTWADGTTATGDPLDLHNPVPRPRAALTDPAAYEAWRLASWRAVYDRAGATLAGSITRGEWQAARGVLAERIAAEGATGTRRPMRLPALETRRAIVADWVESVTIEPAVGGRTVFDPDRVVVKWRA